MAIPLLVLLYVMKLRRRRLTMASTLLWRRAFEDLQVNAPFQRLRVSLLFALQLLVLILLLLAAAEPVIRAEGPASSRLILLIDRSASMRAADVTDASGEATTRLEHAKAETRDVVDRLRRGRSGRSVMIIAFGAQPKLVTGFESRSDVLDAAIDSIEPTDEEADLAAALQLAGTFVTAEEGEGGGDGRPDVVLVSDGGVRPAADQEGFTSRGGPFRFVQAGPPAESETRNVGIVSFSARRDYNDPSQVLVFTRLANAGPERVETTVTIFIDGEPGPVRRVGVDAATPGGGAGEATLSLAVELSDAAVIGARLGTRDALPHDDTAAVVLPPPARPRVALVYAGDAPDPFLEQLIEETSPRVLRPMSAAAFEADLDEDAGLARRFDLLVFDGVTPSRLPPVPSITFGAALPGSVLLSDQGAGGRRILSWRRQHVLMRHVELDPVVYAGGVSFGLPPEATPLATGRDGPVIALVSGGAGAHVQVAFRLGASNWPTHVSVTVFMQNVLEYLTLSRSGQTSLVTRPGGGDDCAARRRLRPRSWSAATTAPWF